MPRKTFAGTVEAWGRFLGQVDETGIEIPGTGSAIPHPSHSQTP
jgi:hypothetical protein